MALRLIVLLAALAFTGLVPAQGQRLAGALTERQIAVNSDFSGQTLTLFGNVEPLTGEAGTAVEGPFQVVVVVTGPAQDRVARLKANRFFMWQNTESVTFRNFPSFKWVLASARLDEIASKDVLKANHILLGSFDDHVMASGNGNVDEFRAALVRLMSEKGLFGTNELGVVFQSSTLYSARITLPGDVPNGNFLAETYLFKNGEVIARKAEGFSVGKAGFERLIGDAARNDPLLYGLTCVCLAVFTGWLGGVIFRR